MKRFHLLVMLALLVIGIGCGGGTRGSGGQLYDGFVGDSSGKALPNVSITILSTGDSAVSNDQGRFLIETEDATGNVEFLLESSQFTGRVVTENVPEDAVRVTVEFTVGAGNTPRIDVEVEVSERRPSPTRTPGRPTATPTAPAGGAAATPTPTTPAPGAPTPTPSSTPDDDSDGGSNSGSGSGDDSSGDDDDDDDDSNTGSGSGTPSATPTATPTKTPRPGDGVDAEGRISAINSSVVVVNGIAFIPAPTSEYRGLNGEPLGLADFAVGEKVKAKGRVGSGGAILEKLEKK